MYLLWNCVLTKGLTGQPERKTNNINGPLELAPVFTGKSPVFIGDTSLLAESEALASCGMIGESSGIESP